MDKRPTGVPSDRAFLMARTAHESVARACDLLKLAYSNIDPKTNAILQDAIGKALIKAKTARTRTDEAFRRESLRVAPQRALELTR